MISTDSSSISSRCSMVGNRAPVTCSFSASPVPTPSVNRPSSRTALVAAAWAMITGWIRMVGQVTAVVIGSRQTCEIAPIIDQTNGL